jgi:hypothetical protein
MKKFNHCGGFLKILRKFNHWLNTLRLGEYPFEETKMKSLPQIRHKNLPLLDLIPCCYWIPLLVFFIGGQ